MSEAIFFRLLDTPIDEKGAMLADRVTELDARIAENLADGINNVFQTNSQSFSLIPGSPFAYWVDSSIRNLFTELPQMQSGGRRVCFGLSTKDDFQFLRLSWEISVQNLHQVWFPFAKGGAYSPYYYDVHLVIDWEDDGARLKAFAEKRTKEIFGTGSWSRWINNWDYYFRPGITWPRRTQKGLNLRALPKNCIFADKGPAIFVPENDPDELLRLLAVTNSLPFQALVQLQMAFGSYEVGVIQRTPIPGDLTTIETALVQEAHDLTRTPDCYDETTHAFCIPGLLTQQKSSLLSASHQLESKSYTRQARLAAIQAQLDETIFDLYGFSHTNRTLIRRQMGQPTLSTSPSLATDIESDEEPPPPENLPDRVQNLLMWCVGVAFGRWDGRFAHHPERLPALQGPFDPLPRCSPGMLIGTDGLPATPGNIASPAWLSARHNVLDIPATDALNGLPASISSHDYPLSIAWDGILVDDPNHSADIIRHVRAVLNYVYEDRADAIEQEACDILEVQSLRDYFRDPRRFFAYHIKRYSKSRRKAPIYWLLQTSQRNYGVWLYYPRLRQYTYLEASRDYVDTKINLERERLQELRQGLAGLEGPTLKQQERRIEQQQKLVDEVTTFGKTLDKIGTSELPPDLNDGVIITMAPLHELVPWKEAARTWDELVAGQYEWSTLSKQMARRNLLKSQKNHA